LRYLTSEWLLWNNLEYTLIPEQGQSSTPLNSFVALLHQDHCTHHYKVSMYWTERNTNLLVQLLLNLLFCHCLLLCNLKNMVKLYLHLFLMRRRDLITWLHASLKWIGIDMTSSRGFSEVFYQKGIRVWYLGRKLLNVVFI